MTEITRTNTGYDLSTIVSTLYVSYCTLAPVKTD